MFEENMEKKMSNKMIENITEIIGKLTNLVKKVKVM